MKKVFLAIAMMVMAFNAVSQKISIKVDFKSETRLVNQPKKSINPCTPDGFQTLDSTCTAILFKTKRGVYFMKVIDLLELNGDSADMKVLFYLENRVLKYTIIK